MSFDVTSIKVSNGMLEFLRTNNTEVNRYHGPCKICGTHITSSESSSEIYLGEGQDAPLLEGPVCFNCIEKLCNSNTTTGDYELKPEMKFIIKVAMERLSHNDNKIPA